MRSRKQVIALYIDPPSYHFLNDMLFVANGPRMTGDHIHLPYTYLHNYFTSKGIIVHTADRMPVRNNGAQIVYVSMGILKNYRQFARRLDVSLSAYFAMECPIVEPSLFTGLVDAQHYFRRIYSWSDSASLERFVGAPLQLKSFCWPQAFNEVHHDIWSRTDRKFLVMINGNRLPRLYWQELYTERLRAVEFFSRTGDIELYGVGWNVPPYRSGKTLMPYTLQQIHRTYLAWWQRIHPNPLLAAARGVYRGTAQSKSEVLGQYTFALCFENMILKGWITEKIFDCFFAGTIPIYWGSPDIESRIPAECFIDMRQFASYQELSKNLKSLSQHDIRRYKENAKSFLTSEKFRPYSKEAFTDIFRRIIAEDTGIQIN